MFARKFSRRFIIFGAIVLLVLASGGLLLSRGRTKADQSIVYSSLLPQPRLGELGGFIFEPE